MRDYLLIIVGKQKDEELCGRRIRQTIHRSSIFDRVIEDKMQLYCPDEATEPYFKRTGSDVF